MITVSLCPLAKANATHHSIRMIAGYKSKTRRVPARRIVVGQDEHHSPAGRHKRALDGSTVSPAVTDRIKGRVVHLVMPSKVVDDEYFFSCIAVEPERASSTQAQSVGVTASILAQLVNSRSLANTRRSMEADHHHLLAVYSRADDRSIRSQAFAVAGKRHRVELSNLAHTLAFLDGGTELLQVHAAALLLSTDICFRWKPVRAANTGLLLGTVSNALLVRATGRFKMSMATKNALSIGSAAAHFEFYISLKMVRARLAHLLLVHARGHSPAIQRQQPVRVVNCKNEAARSHLTQTFPDTRHEVSKVIVA